ncbi:N-acetylmuramoyl-L-alanine amidase [Luteimonas sp. MJ204]|uniref:N-acetylmuramoyl-L-alanine amidase n=1 Tax=Luteimonas sp. MJ145 TaxID=3129234 RepID=UPI0031BB8916
MNIKPLAAVLCLALLAGCVHQPPRNPMATWVPSPNHDERRAVVIVLHYTEQDSVEQSLRTLSTRNSGGPVSSHYLVGDDGAIYQLVADSRRAWHAGGGRWGTITDLNSASIGIEIDNDGREPFTEPQVQALLRLLEDLTARLRIPRSQVIGHSDLAPSRKIDPGALFPWKRLAEAGFGIWPADDAPPAPEGFDAMRALRLVGYDISDPEATIRAFRLRFRGDALTVLDKEDLRILHALTLPEGAGLLVPAP